MKPKFKKGELVKIRNWEFLKNDLAVIKKVQFCYEVEYKTGGSNSGVEEFMIKKIKAKKSKK